MKIENLESKVKFFSLKENKIQEGMSLIQQTSNKIDNLKTMSERLNKLSVEYNKEDLDDNKAVKNEAKKILSDIDNLMTDVFGDKSSIFNKQVFIPDETVSGKGSTVFIKDLNIQLEDSKDKNNNKEIIPKNEKKADNKINIEGDLSIDNILKDTNRIEDKLINPLNEYSNYLNQQTTNLQSITLFDDINLSIYSRDLDNLKKSYNSAGKYTDLNNLIMQNSQNAITAQSSYINSDIVLKLI